MHRIDTAKQAVSYLNAIIISTGEIHSLPCCRTISQAVLSGTRDETRKQSNDEITEQSLNHQSIFEIGYKKIPRGSRVYLASCGLPVQRSAISVNHADCRCTYTFVIVGFNRTVQKKSVTIIRLRIYKFYILVDTVNYSPLYVGTTLGMWE